MQERLLREYIRETLVNEGLESFSGLEAIFVTPFTDVFKTGKKVVADISSKSQQLIGGAMASIVAAFVPGMTVDWEELKQKERARAAKIEGKYSDVIDRTNAALFTGDGAVMSFMYAPHAFITSHAMNVAPDAALEMMDTLGGENEYVSRVTNALRKQWEKLRIDTTKRRPDVGGGGYGYGGGGGGGDYGGYGDDGGDGGDEAVERDDEDVLSDGEIMMAEGILDKLKEKLQGMFKNKQMEQAISNSSKTKQMRKDAVAITKSHVEAVVKKAKQATNTKSTKTLEKYSGGKFKATMGKISSDDRRKAAAVVAQQTAKLAKKFYVDKLKEEAKSMPKGLQQIYMQGVKAIKGM